MHIRKTLDLLYCQYDMKSLQLSQPHLLIVVGAPRSGKSTFATRFSETFHTPFINGGILTSVAADHQAALRLASVMFTELQKTKQTLIYEPVTGIKAERTMLAKVARKHGYVPLLVWVQTDRHIAEARATQKSRHNPHPITAKEFEQQLKHFTAPGKGEQYVVISGMHTYATQAKAVLRKLSEQVVRSAPAVRAPERTETPRQTRTVTVR